MTTNNWESKIKEGKESIPYYEETGIKEISTALGLASWHVNTDKLKSFISSLLESQRQEIVQEIIEKYGKYYTDGCGCCMSGSLGKALEEDYPSLQVNKDL